MLILPFLLTSLMSPPDGSALQHRVLPDTIRVCSTPYFENAARAVPPSRACPQGRLVFSTGQPRSTAALLSRPLLDERGQIDLETQASAIKYPLSPTQAIGTDNQIVRLKDGSLLATKDSYIWDEFAGAPPPWRDEVVTGSGNHRAQRAGVLIFRSTDGGDHWVQRGKVDMGEVLGGKFGVPRPMDANGRADVPPAQQGRHPDGNLRWWVGGPDRTEVYACPFTGSVYLTTRVISGPYKDICPKLDRLLLLRSRDAGKTWECIREDFPSWSPMVMTSTPNGRLFLMQYLGSQPTVYYSTNLPLGRVKPVFSPGYPVHYVEEGKPVIGAGGKDVDLFFQIGHPSISRLSVDTRSSAVRVAYQSCGPAGTQSARVVRAEVIDSGKAPTVTNIATVSASDPDNASVMYASFIDPDYVDMPQGVRSSTSLLYWIEAPKKQLPDRTWTARYVLFGGDGQVTAPGCLATTAGAPRLWTKRQDVGDYMSGGFFWWRRTLHYVPQWAEPDGLKANIVAVPYDSQPHQ